MKDAACTAFLQWALPRMGLEWAGFRRVRRLVCKRIDRRARALGLADLAAYRQRLEVTPAEWQALRGLCSIPISRFFRDREVFHALEESVLPALAAAATERGARTLECWSAGCASGEEPYSLSILWKLGLAARYPALTLHVIGTDVDAILLERAGTACYPASELRELPPAWRAIAFERRDGRYCLREPFRTHVEIMCQDLCADMPEQLFDVICCRNVAFTYFGRPLQLETVRQLANRLRAGGALVIGVHESLPVETADLLPWPGVRAVFRKTAGPAAATTASRAPTGSALNRV